MPETHPRSGSRTRPAPRLLLALIVLTSTLTTGLVATATGAEAKAIKPARASYTRAIEPLAAYQPQTTCSPTAKPGVANFAARLLQAFPSTRSLGIVRACAAGGRSEHKEGRAFDWGVSARSAADRKRVDRMLSWLFTKDKYGNDFAMARRLGIQYVIWNHKIWGAYSAGAGWRKYTGANPHTDHVHISFTWAGARGKTSFWTGKVGKVGAAPAPTLPGTPITPPATPSRPGDPTPTGDTTPPRPQPRPAASLLPGPELVDETVSLPAASEGALTTGSLTAGTGYLIEATGTYKWGQKPNQVADAECSKAPGDAVWRRDRSVHSWDPTNDHLDLYVDGTDMLAEPDVDSGDDCDTRTHTYRWTYQPARSGRVTFAVWDPTTLADNSGTLSIRVLAVVPRDEMAVAVPATAAAGVTTPGALETGGTYAVTVSGTVDAGGGVVADAECSTSTTDPVWRRDRSVLATDPTADHLDLLVDRDDVTFTPVSDPDGDGCDSDTHTYRWVTTAGRTAPINLRVDDPVWSDDAAELQVTVSRVRPAVDTETVTVDSAGAPVSSGRIYLAGQPLRITATGTYTWAAGTTADAECSSTTTDPTWRSTRSTMLVDGRYLGDVTVNGSLPDWTTSSGARCDATTHSYLLTYTPRQTGPLTLGVADLDLTDNAGALTVTIGPA